MDINIIVYISCQHIVVGGRIKKNFFKPFIFFKNKNKQTKKLMNSFNEIKKTLVLHLKSSSSLPSSTSYSADDNSNGIWNELQDIQDKEISRIITQKILINLKENIDAYVEYDNSSTVKDIHHQQQQLETGKCNCQINQYKDYYDIVFSSIDRTVLTLDFLEMIVGLNPKGIKDININVKKRDTTEPVLTRIFSVTVSVFYNKISKNTIAKSMNAFKFVKWRQTISLEKLNTIEQQYENNTNNIQKFIFLPVEFGKFHKSQLAKIMDVLQNMDYKIPQINWNIDYDVENECYLLTMVNLMHLSYSFLEYFFDEFGTNNIVNLYFGRYYKDGGDGAALVVVVNFSEKSQTEKALRNKTTIAHRIIPILSDEDNQSINNNVDTNLKRKIKESESTDEYHTKMIGPEGVFIPITNDLNVRQRHKKAKENE